MAEVSEVHVRVNGWCHTCGGTGFAADVKHENKLTLTHFETATWVAGWVRHLYVDLEQSTGGPLHVVLDDGNVADEFLTEREDRYAFLLDGRFEQYAQAGEDVSTGRKVAIRETCEMILAGLRRLPESERRMAIAAAGVWETDGKRQSSDWSTAAVEVALLAPDVIGGEKTWTPWPGLHVRASHLPDGNGFGLEVWRRNDHDGWDYTVLLPPAAVRTPWGTGS